MLRINSSPIELHSWDALQAWTVGHVEKHDERPRRCDKKLILVICVHAKQKYPSSDEELRNQLLLSY